jgi:hypothetical protein
MLRVKIELVPFGDEAGARVIHSLYIGNVGGSADTASYHAWLDVDPREVRPRPEPHGVVNDYERAKGAVRLTALCIQAIQGGRPRKSSDAEARKCGLCLPDKPCNWEKCPDDPANAPARARTGCTNLINTDISLESKDGDSIQPCQHQNAVRVDSDEWICVYCRNRIARPQQGDEYGK